MRARAHRTLPLWLIRSFARARVRRASTVPHPGVIPRALHDIFSSIETAAAGNPDTIFLVRMSYVELYNNNFRNLLNGAAELQRKRPPDATTTTTASGPTTSPPKPPVMTADSGVPVHARSNKIEVRESKATGVFLQGPGVHVAVTSKEDAAELIALGDRARAAGVTNCNEHSSRSHAILTFHIESRALDHATTEATNEVKMGKLHLIDLAGRHARARERQPMRCVSRPRERALPSRRRARAQRAIVVIGLGGRSLGRNPEHQPLARIARGRPLSCLAQRRHHHRAPARSSRGTEIAPARGQSDAGARAISQLQADPPAKGEVAHLIACVPRAHDMKAFAAWQDSLGGNSKTMMITTLCASSKFYSQVLPRRRRRCSRDMS